MAEENNLPWDSETDQFISSLDQVTTEQNGISLRDLLLNSDKYVGQKDIVKKIGEVKESVNEFFSGLIGNMKDEKEKLDKELEDADEEYAKVNKLVSEQTMSSKIPFITPLLVDVNPDFKEEIVIERYSDGISELVEKLSSTSNFVADISTGYKDHKLGSWLFSGNKPYVLTIKPPTSAVTIVEDSNDTVIQLLDEISERAKEEEVANT